MLPQFGSFGLCNPCFNLLLAPLGPPCLLLLLSASLGICMSASSYHGADIEIQVRIRDLAITVVGPATSATRFIEEVTRAASESARETTSPRGTDSSYSVVEPVSEPQLETRDQILRSFPDCPNRLLQLSRRLGGLQPFAESRIRRAWVAGLWAQAVLEGRVFSPNRTEPIQLRSRIYVVLRCAGVSTPVAFSSANSYWRTIGRLEDGNTLSHSFPSETEARIYTEGAGFDFPTVQP